YGDMPDLTLACDPRAAVSLVDSSPSPPMTQFSGRRESWAPLNLIHNRELAPHACEVANRSCELLLTRPEIARCDAKAGPRHGHQAPLLDGAAAARRAPGAARAPRGEHGRGQPHRGLAGRRGRGLRRHVHPHVRHQGAETRYLLIAWFCHPCDPVHAEVPAEDPMGMCAP
ncbi:unnamed protein product, partial [Prorocentrum cordatum]